MQAQPSTPLFRKIDCLQIPIPDLDLALAFYRDALGHELIWRTATSVGLRLPDAGAELVLQTERPELECNLLVASADAAVIAIVEAGGSIVVAPFDILIGRCAVVQDPWNNRLVLLDMIKGSLVTNAHGSIIGNAHPIPINGVDPQAIERDVAMPLKLLSPAKALRTLRKTAILLDVILEGVPNDAAQAPLGNNDDWDLFAILRHLWEYEIVIARRIQLMLDEENPLLPTTTGEASESSGDRAPQNLQAVVADWHGRRQTLIDLLEGLSDDQWQHAGTHPQQGSATMLDVAINAGLHDIDHIEQIARLYSATS